MNRNIHGLLRMNRYRLLLVLAALALAACGGDEANPDTDTGGVEDTGSETTPDPDTGEDTGEDPATDPGGNDTGGEDAPAPEYQTCTADTDCDDGLACTTDTCVMVDGVGTICQWEQAADTCLINNVCYAPGDPNPNGTCEACDAATPNEWAPASDGMSCSGGNACLVGGECEAGECVGATEISCDDGNSCTVDSCSPATGCINDAVANGLDMACDDGDTCTVGDRCVDGMCTGDVATCDDGNPCTDDECVSGEGCVSTNNTASCEDGNPCTVDDVCSEGVCNGGGPNDCNDFNECTIDQCDEMAGCINLPTFNPCCTGAVSVCDDGDPCTTDLCDPETAACDYELNVAPCDDGNACTVDDICGDGVCGGAMADCDDGNACTDDSCNVTVGCINDALTGMACDDGVECTTAEMCDAGICVATDTSGCLCTPSFSDDSGKVNSVALGPNEVDGNALDINGDGMNDNALGPLGSFVNEPIGDAITDGSLMLVLEFIDFNGTPGDFQIALHQSDLAPANAMCDFQADTCDYLVDRGLIDPDTCEPTVLLPAFYDGAIITAGGPGTNLPFSIPFSDGASLDITLYNLTVELSPTIAGGDVTAFEGILGGAATEEELNAAILALPEDSLPLAPGALVDLLATLAPNDIDTTGDGALDAKSIALLVTGIDSNIVGAQ